MDYFFFLYRGRWRLIRRTTVIAGDVAAQTDRAMRNLPAILKAVAANLEKVVRATVSKEI